MNTQLIRWLISITGAAETEPRTWVRLLLRFSPSARTALQDERLLLARLRAEAATESLQGDRECPPFLQARIMAAVKNEAMAESSRIIPFGFVRSPLSMAAGLAFFCGLFYLFGPGRNPGNPGNVPIHPNPTVVASGGMFSMASAPALNDFTDPMNEMMPGMGSLMNEPYSRELEGLVADAKGAAVFFANCVTLPLDSEQVSRE